MKTWVKLYTEIVNDPEIAELSLAERGMWMMLLALAGQLDDRDEQDRETGRLDSAARIAWYLRCGMAELQPIIETLARLDMVDDRDGILYLTNYAKRQATPPSARNVAVRERVQEHRAKTPQPPANVTPLHTDCNEPVTHLDKSRVDKSRGEGEKTAQQPAPKLDPSIPLHLQEDPRPPAIRIFVQEAKFMPAPGSVPYKTICDAVPTNDKKAQERWREAIQAWLNNGNSSRNVQGMIDWFKSGKRDNRMRTPEPVETPEDQRKKLLDKVDAWNLAHGIGEDNAT